ncbi:MAG: magnesium chelatase domain-containing protein [Anaerolineales bacterium]
MLTRRAGIKLTDQDVYVNVVGGLKISEPAADLATAAAIASSVKDRPVKADTILIGEIGLSGELRLASRMSDRLGEAAKLGFKSAIVPKQLRGASYNWPKGLEVIEVRSLDQALKASLLNK